MPALRFCAIRDFLNMEDMEVWYSFSLILTPSNAFSLSNDSGLISDVSDSPGTTTAPESGDLSTPADGSTPAVPNRTIRKNGKLFSSIW